MSSAIVIGNLAAILLGALFVEFPIVERVLLKLAIASYCIPLVAIAPIFVVVLSGDGPKVALAALSVFFTTLVATVLGLRTMDAVNVDLVRSAGGGAWKVFRIVRVPGALPSVFAGLRVAAPAALLGAVIGEYLGASQGLGVALIQAQSSFEVERAWGVALVMALLGGLLYAIASLAARVGDALGRARGDHRAGHDRHGARAGARLPPRALRFPVLHCLDRRRDPDLVWADPAFPAQLILRQDAARRLALSRHRRRWRRTTGPISSMPWAMTLIDAGTGYVAGTVVAMLVAAVMAIVPAVEQAIMPSAIVLRSIPIVAMAPLIALVFGRGLLGVTVVVGLVTFFPTLVYLVSGSPLGAGARLRDRRLVRRLPPRGCAEGEVVYALPALFAAARIAVPAAIGGATLAEWLSTGSGIGNLARAFLFGFEVLHPVVGKRRGGCAFGRLLCRDRPCRRRPASPLRDSDRGVGAPGLRWRGAELQAFAIPDPP